MGTLIVRERIPAFIITLGGLLVFKGTFWLVIGSHTIPVVAGGATNLYSLLTTFYLSPAASGALVAAVFVTLVVLELRARRRRQSLGFAIDDAEMAFLKLFVTAQGLLLFVLVVQELF